MIGYNHSIIVLQDKTADTVAVKGLSSAVQIYDLTNGKVEINTDAYTAGDYFIQFFKGNEVIKEDTLIIKENLKYVSSAYDPRSNAAKILDAINAYLAGVATHQQRRIKVGEK